MRFRGPTLRYALTRPYPYAWFTPLAFLGAVILVAVFSIINFISNGYTLVVTTTPDPNSTIAENQLFRKWPHYLTDRIQPSCDPVNLAVNSQISTNQSAWFYTITGVDQSDTVLPSLTYQNNLLEHCSGSQSSWITTVRAIISCQLALQAGVTRLNLTAVYNFVPDGKIDLPGVSKLIVQDKQKRASLWWAESLLSYYWSQMNYYLTEIDRTYNASDGGGAFGALQKGYIDYRRNPNVQELEDLSFFEMDFSFAQPTSLYNNQVDDWYIWWPGTQQLTNESLVTTQVALDYNAYPPIWTIADSLGKSMYAAVLTDLGQVNDTASNIVLLPKTLQHFSSNFTWYMDTWNASTGHGEGRTTLTQPGPATADFETMRDEVGPLGITPSVISTKYICQVPRKRSSGNIALSIILADLVLLQAAWKLYTLIVDWSLVRRMPGSNYCEACGGSDGDRKSGSPTPRQEESIELLTRPSQSSETPFASVYARPGYIREDTGRSLASLQRSQSPVS